MEVKRLQVKLVSLKQIISLLISGWRTSCGPGGDLWWCWRNICSSAAVTHFCLCSGVKKQEHLQIISEKDAEEVCEVRLRKRLRLSLHLCLPLQVMTGTTSCLKFRELWSFLSSCTSSTTWICSSGGETLPALPSSPRWFHFIYMLIRSSEFNNDHNLF